MHELHYQFFCYCLEEVAFSACGEKKNVECMGHTMCPSCYDCRTNGSDTSDHVWCVYSIAKYVYDTLVYCQEYIGHPYHYHMGRELLSPSRHLHAFCGRGGLCLGFTGELCPVFLFFLPDNWYSLQGVHSTFCSYNSTLTELI